MNGRRRMALLAIVGGALFTIACSPVTGPGGEAPDNTESAEYLGMVLAGSSGITTSGSQSVVTRAITGSVQELNIGSADIFAFDYDEANARWDSPAGVSGSGNTHDNDAKAILITDGLSFTPEGNDLTDLVSMNNMPNTVDIIYFDNSWHNVTVDGIQYGDHTRNGSYLPRTNRLPDGSQFTQFDIVFVSDAIVSENCLVRRSGPFEMVTSGVANASEILAQVEKIHAEVRAVEQYALLIPMSSFAFDPVSVAIEISVDLATLVDEVTSSDVMYSLDADGSPITYSISVGDAIDTVDFDDDGSNDKDDNPGSTRRVSEFNIGSADIFSFAYDSVNDRWDSPAGVSQSGNTYENDTKALLITDALGFTAGMKNVASLVTPENFPSTIDILYFDNSWHNVTVDGVQYGDHNRNGSYLPRTNRLPDGSEFTQFDIVYVDRSIVPVGCLVRRSSGSLVMETEGVADEAGILAAVEKISNEVRYIEQYALFIPIDPIQYNRSSTTIVVGIRTDNLISEIGVSDVSFALDKNGSPLTYLIAANTN